MLSSNLVKTRIDRCEKQISLLKTDWLMANHLTIDNDLFDQYNRKVSVLDIEIAEQDLVLRADLDVPLSTYVPPAPLDEQFGSLISIQEDSVAKATSSRKVKGKKKTKVQIQEEMELQAAYD